MAIIELESSELINHEAHDLTVEVDDTIKLYCSTCCTTLAEVELPTYRATVRLVGTAWVTRNAVSEDAMMQMVEDMYFPGDADDYEIEVDDIDIEED